MTHSDIAICSDCGEPVEAQDVPQWKEFRLFGVTWLLGRWGKCYPDQCIECQTSKENRSLDRAFESVGQDAYDQGYADGAREASHGRY